MALANVILLSQIAGHVISFILSICILIPMIFHVSEFSGHCLLFASGNWREEDGLFNVNWASQGYCNYSIVIAVFLLLVSLYQIYRFSCLLYREQESSFLGLFLDVLFGIILCMNVLIAAIIITLGFIQWCSKMSQRFPSCETAAGQNITKEDQKINTSGFYMEMGTAQFGAWGSFAIWVGLSVFALLKLISNHQMRNMKISMYLERQRLVNEDASRGNQDDSGVNTPEAEISDHDFPHQS